MIQVDRNIVSFLKNVKRILTLESKDSNIDRKDALLPKLRNATTTRVAII